MALGFDSRVGLAGLFLALFGIAATYLWPDKKWIGWICMVFAAILLLSWGILEIRQYLGTGTVSLVASIILGCILGGGTATLLWFSVTGEKSDVAGVVPKTDSPAIQLDASVTLASGSFNESCGMWIAIGAGAGKLLSPANVAADLRATNLTDHPVRILEILATAGEDPTKSYLFRLPFYETKLIFGDLKSVGALHQLVSTTSSSLSFQENAKNPIPARQSIDGWVLFEYPSGLTGVDVRSVRFVARTDYGDFPVSGLGMGTFTGGGAHVKPLPDAIDFREYRVERYSAFINRPPAP